MAGAASECSRRNDKIQLPPGILSSCRGDHVENFGGSCLPGPLPRGFGLGRELHKYFLLLWSAFWHSIKTVNRNHALF